MSAGQKFWLPVSLSLQCLPWKVMSVFRVESYRWGNTWRLPAGVLKLNPAIVVEEDETMRCWCAGCRTPMLARSTGTGWRWGTDDEGVWLNVESGGWKLCLGGWIRFAVAQRWCNSPPAEKRTTNEWKRRWTVGRRESTQKSHVTTKGRPKLSPIKHNWS